jgi:hypothetical protein
MFLQGQSHRRASPYRLMSSVAYDLAVTDVLCVIGVPLIRDSRTGARRDTLGDGSAADLAAVGWSLENVAAEARDSPAHRGSPFVLALAA